MDSSVLQYVQYSIHTCSHFWRKREKEEERGKKKEERKRERELKHPNMATGRVGSEWCGDPTTQ